MSVTSEYTPISSASTAPSLDVVGVAQTIDGQTRLHNITFSVSPGEVVAVAGGSGAGKTTLLQVMAGLATPSAGDVFVDRQPRADSVGDTDVAYVPQDDIIHMELPLRRTIDHAAQLRLGEAVSDADREAIVTRTLARLDLCGRDDVAVGDLSGGQRKRASIASELLTDPRLLFLDEPTSGLDPATSAGVVDHLRQVAASGTTVVLTTHSPADLNRCDRIVFLARDGHLAFEGSPEQALAYFGVERLAEVYEVMAGEDPVELGRQFEAHRLDSFLTADFDAPAADVEPVHGPTKRVGFSRQWFALTRRGIDLLLNNRLTLAILIGSPAMVVAMMAVLFRPGTFSPEQVSPVPAIQTVFWIAFASFFFGLTYGLLQVVGEFNIFVRERFSGLRVGAYVTSKIAVLVPVLFAVNVVMLAVLRALDRLPAMSAVSWVELLVTLQLISTAALSLGLLASSAVQNASQATMALPMLCFPQVLFAGAVVAIDEMATAGRVMSFGLADRWGFEALGNTLGLVEIIGDDSATASYVSAFDNSLVTAWVVLGAMTVAGLFATTAVLSRRSRS
ncbi:MAG: ATP-binding cassette domain-containing protein [Acidimicrobiales bacterium]